MRILILAATAAALLVGPALAAGPTTPAKPSKMAACAAQWKAIGDKGHGPYNDRAKTMKSKKGNAMSGYNVFTGECMKKR